MTDYRAAWRVRTRRQAMEFLGGACVWCGALEGLEFDHVIAATKDFEISKAIADCYSWARIQVELLKCQLLCRPCHVEKTAQNMENGQVDHGGGLSGKKNCKCIPCKARKAEYMRGYMRSSRKKHADVAQR
jgi:hypothetical protein